MPCRTSRVGGFFVGARTDAAGRTNRGPPVPGSPPGRTHSTGGIREAPGAGLTSFEVAERLFSPRDPRLTTISWNQDASGHWAAGAGSYGSPSPVPTSSCKRCGYSCTGSSSVKGRPKRLTATTSAGTTSSGSASQLRPGRIEPRRGDQAAMSGIRMSISACGVRTSSAVPPICSTSILTS